MIKKAEIKRLKPEGKGMPKMVENPPKARKR